MSRIELVLLCGLAMSVGLAGCGDTPRRSGPPGTDSGPTSIDGGRTGVDAGPGLPDTGPPIGIDSGPPIGIDSGPGLPDAGPRDSGLSLPDTGFPIADGGGLPGLDGALPGVCVVDSDCAPGEMCCELIPGLTFCLASCMGFP